MAKRRQWIEDLKSCNEEVKSPKKKPKIQVLSEKTYIHGILVNEKTVTPPACSSKTPQHVKRINKELTPTFRHPETYMKETKEVLKKITPCKPNYCDEIFSQTGVNKNVYFKEELFNNIKIDHCEEIPDSYPYHVTVTVDPLPDLDLDDSIILTLCKEGQTDHAPPTTSPVPGTSSALCNGRSASIQPSTSPVPGTNTAFREGRSASGSPNTSPVPGTSSALRESRSTSTPQSTSTVPGTSSAIREGRSATIPLSTYLVPRTSSAFREGRSASVPPCTSTVPGTSSAIRESRSASVPPSTSTVPGTSSAFQKDRFASIPPSTSPHSSVVHESQALNVPRSISPGMGTTFYEGRAATVTESSQSSPTYCVKTNFKNKQRNKRPRQCKKKLDFKKAYFDFLDETDADDILLNEAFPSEDSGSWTEQNTSSESDDVDNHPQAMKKKRPKKKTEIKGKKGKKGLKFKKTKKTEPAETKSIKLEKKKPKSLIKKENGIRRQSGKSYVNRKGTLVEGKEMKPNPCIGKKCRNGCGEISEERRQRLFEFYWNLQSQQRRKDWIAQITVKKPVNKRTIDTPSTSRRKVTYEYFINEGEERRQVCQQFLIATLDISQRFILYTAETTIDGFAKQDERGKHGKHNKTPEEVIQHAKLFISSLPLLPSHYCRKESSKLYLSEDIKNLTNLYDIYVKHCNEDEEKPMSFKVFSMFFKTNYNISFHVPRKDKCVLCASTKTFDVQTKEEVDKINLHIKEKDECKDRFLFHQSLREKDKNVVCASFDLQKVLNTPHGTNMALYYSRKIAVYNFTIYESGTQFGFCNIWSEIDGHRGANEISTCLLSYIKNVDSRQVKILLLYSDSCFGQNKNKTVLSMLRYALNKCIHLDSIQINFLLPGHTYMPVDSMHAIIERAVRKTTIWAPSHWPTVIKMARKNPFPYEVTELEGHNFMGFDDILNKTFKKNQKIMMSNIRIATFKKSNPDVMLVKHSMAPDAQYIEIKLGNIGNTEPRLNLYSAKIPISEQKYNDLKKLVEKKVIPSSCAQEYLAMKHTKKTVDRLPDTDEED